MPKTNKTGKQTYPSADRLLKRVPSPEISQNTPPEMILPSEGKDSVPPPRMQVSVLPTMKPTQATGVTLPARAETK